MKGSFLSKLYRGAQVPGERAEDFQSPVPFKDESPASWARYLARPSGGYFGFALPAIRTRLPARDPSVTSLGLADRCGDRVYLVLVEAKRGGCKVVFEVRACCGAGDGQCDGRDR